MKVETNYWLEKVVLWRKENIATLSNIASQLAACEQLTSYLQQLKVFMQDQNGVDSVMVKVPGIGQLLGRICSLPALLQHKQLYSALVGCLLCFCIDHPVTAVEKKAKTWAVAQIRSTISDQKAQLHLSGYNAALFYDKCLHLLSSSISCDALMTNSLLPCSKICVHLSHIPQFAQLLDNIVQVAISSDSPDAEALMQAVFEARQYEDNDTVPLQSLQQLWQWQPAVVETEVMNLVDQCRRNYSTDIIYSKRLILLFRHFPPAWHLASNLLRTLWHSTGHSAVAMATASLTMMLHKENHSTIPCLDDPSLHSVLRTLQQFSPTNMGLEAVCALLHLLASDLQPTAPDWLMQHPDWWITILCLPLVTNQQVATDCASFICGMFKSSASSQSLQDLFNCLRVLLSKSLITPQDLQCALLNQNVPRPVIRQTLLLFVILANKMSDDTKTYLFEQGCCLLLSSAKLLAILQTLYHLQQHLSCVFLTLNHHRLHQLVNEMAALVDNSNDEKVQGLNSDNNDVFKDDWLSSPLLQRGSIDKQTDHSSGINTKNDNCDMLMHTDNVHSSQTNNLCSPKQNDGKLKNMVQVVLDALQKELTVL